MNRKSYPRRNSTFHLFFLLSVILGVVTLGVLRWCGMPWLGAYLIAISLATVCAYFYDKSASVNGYRRVPENLLHLLAALGGSPAAFASQAAFRHKTLKRSFRNRFWIICAAQGVLLGVWAYFGWR